MSVAASAPTSSATRVVSPRHAGPEPGSLQSQRTKLTAAEWKEENHRRLALRVKHAEKDALGFADDEHRRNVHHLLAGRKKILDEVRSVRDMTHSNLEHQRPRPDMTRVLQTRRLHVLGTWP